MDIKSGAGYPAASLSNFPPQPFVIDGVKCASREGFLQSLKFENPEMQEYICTLVGIKAKMKGKNKNWQRNQTLYWRGNPINRHSQEYQDLLDRMYEECAKQNETFRKALIASGDAVLTHSIGNGNPSETVLTRQELCGRLTKLREKIKKGLL
jgi:predicted NAD-dependent protein-ADP-ribosyltransferase YbiA (DUF1768 family)